MISVNGKIIPHHPDITVKELVEVLRFDFPHLFVRVNRKIVDRDEWANYIVPNSAEVEIVPIISGG